jgi:hypothetical protein
VDVFVTLLSYRPVNVGVMKSPDIVKVDRTRRLPIMHMNTDGPSFDMLKPLTPQSASA